MSKCQSIDPFVTPFVDGELADAERHLVEAHLRACPPCHSRVAAERAVHELVRDRRDGLRAACAPAALRTRCTGLARESAMDRAAGDNPEPVRSPQSAIGNQPAIRNQPALRHPQPAMRRPSAWRSQVAPFALAASLVVGVGGAFLYQATDRSARVMAAELTADHVKCFALDGVLGTHDSAAAVESSMMSSFGWRMQLPSDTSRAGLELVGSRPCLYGEGKIAHIMYRHEGKPVSLFMLPRSARTSELVEVLGHEAAIWCAGNRTFVLIAREPKRDVERLASYVQASLH
jgi:anti-sigma factor RsiW